MSSRCCFSAASLAHSLPDSYIYLRALALGVSFDRTRRISRLVHALRRRRLRTCSSASRRRASAT
eukprot:1775833-Pleurochrysis_carterae.AAC.2